MFVGKPYTYSVDWWALGIIIYECTYNIVSVEFSRQHPFKRSSSSSFERAVRDSPVQFPASQDIITGRFPFAESALRNKFITDLLAKSVNERIGSSQNGFAEDIITHPWMAEIDWRLVDERKLFPDFVPDVPQPC